MFDERSHWISLIFGIGAIFLWTELEIYGTVGIIGIIVAFIVGSMVGGGIWMGANALTNDWFDDTHVIPGVLLGLFLGAIAGLLLDGSEVLPGSMFYVIGAGGLLGLGIGLVMDASARRLAHENYLRYQAEIADMDRTSAAEPAAPAQLFYRAYVIDPVGRTIEEVDCDGSLPAIQGLVDARSVEGAPLGAGGDIIYVDSMGLYKEGQHAFSIESRPQPLYGKGLLIGTGIDGECADAIIDLEQVQGLVTWLGLTVPE